MSFSVGDKVIWAWGNGEAEGTVTQCFTDNVSRTLKGTRVTRRASPEEPAFLIEQSDGAEVLKSCTELNAS